MATEEDRRVLHNVHMSGVDKSGNITLTFSQFTDSEGRRCMPGRPVSVVVSSMASLELALEVAQRAGATAMDADHRRRAPLPGHTVRID